MQRFGPLTPSNRDPQATTFGSETASVDSDRALQLASALEADVEWRSHHRAELERQISRVKKVYSPIVFPIAFAAVWLAGWQIDRLFFGGNLWMGPPPGTAPDSPLSNSAAVFNTLVITGGMLVGSLASSCCSIFWGDRVKKDLAMTSGPSEEQSEA